MSKNKALNQAQVSAKLHQKIEQAKKQYKENIDWVLEQIKLGHIDQQKLIEIICSVTITNTHQSPIEQTIDQQYSEPSLTELIKNKTVEGTNHIIHKAAKLLTLKQLNRNSFPNICLIEPAMTRR